MNQSENLTDSDESDIDDTKNKVSALEKTHGKKKARLLLKNRSLRPVAKQGLEGESSAADFEEDDLLIPKDSSTHLDLSDDDEMVSLVKPVSSKSLKKKLLKIRPGGESAAVDLAAVNHVKFSENGNAENFYGNLRIGSPSISAVNLEDRVRERMLTVKQKIDSERKLDEERERQRVREKHKKIKLQAKQDNPQNGAGAVLTNYIEEDSEVVENSDHDSDDSLPQSNHRDYVSSETDSEGDFVQKKKRKIQRENKKKVVELSIEEQEKLALKLIS
jgi:hypothetical protein